MEAVTQARSYRCSYHPQDFNGHPAPSEAGVLPYIQLKARDAEDAQRKAYAVTGCPVVQVERLEVAA